jgi:tetratricopeptide (TPR) repeat protein
MPMRCLRVSFCIALIVLLWSASAAARQPSAQDQEQARQHFDQGALFYTQGEYGRAIVEFLKGHELAPHAMFLYNISLSYENLQNYRQALGAAERAKNFAGMPDPVIVRNDARIAAFRIRLEVESVADAMSQQATQKPEEKIVEPPPVASRPMGTMGWAGVAAAGVGVALLGGAGYMQMAMQPNLEDYRAAGEAGNRAQYNTLRTELEGQQSTGRILLYSGSALALTGVTLVVLDRRGGSEDTPKRAQLSITPKPSGASLGLTVSY